MANVLLGATGSVAAVRVPALAAELAAAGHDVKVVATDAAAYFFDPADPALAGRLYRDADEWPGARYERGDSVLHVELRTWADLFRIAPLDANTLAKLAVGLCDNCLTCVWRAWDMTRPVVLAPAMNTLMWEHPFTRRHLRSLAADFGAGHIPGHLDGAPLLAQINDRSPTLRVVPPITKQLACGDVGVGAMAEVPDVVAAVRDAVARRAA
jgi:phosphopantothenoylcysteine decarboxylase